MGDEIWINYSDLRTLNEQLKSIVQELDEAASRTDAVQDAIGMPYGKTSLRDRVHEFEGRWDDKRKDLSRDIDKVQKHVDGVIKGLEKWDTETASQIEVDASGANSSPRAAR